MVDNDTSESVRERLDKLDLRTMRSNIAKVGHFWFWIEIVREEGAGAWSTPRIVINDVKDDIVFFIVVGEGSVGDMRYELKMAESALRVAISTAELATGIKAVTDEW